MGLLALGSAAAQSLPAQADDGSDDLAWNVSETFVNFGFENLSGVSYDSVAEQFRFPSDGTNWTADGTLMASFSGSAQKGFAMGGTVYYTVTVADPRVFVDPDGTGRIEATVHSTGSFRDPDVTTVPTQVTVAEFTGATVEDDVVSGMPDWDGVLPAGSAKAVDLGIDNSEQPVEGRSFHPDFLAAIHPDVRAHFHATGPADTKRPGDFRFAARGGGSTPEPEPTPGPTAEPEPTADPEPTAEPEPTADPDPVGPSEDARKVTDAVFNWSVSDQTNARSHNPAAINFLAAGRANPGRGGATLRESQWRAKAGAVTVQKRTAAGRWRKATWEGLSTDAQGDRIDVYGPFSGHRVNITGGSGEIDPATNSAELAWKGTFTIVYYGGNTVFTLTNPSITVTDGTGTLTATGGGWAADRNDPTTWVPVTPTRLTVSTLSGVDVTDEGIVVTPDYAGVRVTGSVAQRTTGDDWGSFHQEFVTFLEPLGTDQFWYSTGLESDRTKLPSPVSVGWAGADPPEVTPTEPPTTRPEPKNPITDAPSVPPAPTIPSLIPPSGPTASSPLPQAPPFVANQPSLTDVWFPGQPVQVTAVTTDVVALAGEQRSTSASLYTAGGLLLGAAVLLLLGPARRRA